MDHRKRAENGGQELQAWPDRLQELCSEAVLTGPDGEVVRRLGGLVVPEAVCKAMAASALERLHEWIALQLPEEAQVSSNCRCVICQALERLQRRKEEQ
jgi:hypothetical protein